MSGFALRWLGAFGLLTLSFNPTPWNYVEWATGAEARLPLVVLAGLLLFTGYVIYLRATLRSIGVFGMLLVLAIVGALLWVLIDLGWLRLDNGTVNTWLGLIALATVMGIGLSWSHVRRALSGQADIDDVDE